MNEVRNPSRRGTWLIVRCFGDEAKRVRLWEENEHAVWVVSDENYRLLTKELIGLWPIGFRRDAVFVDNPEWVDTWESSTAAFWSGLQPFPPLDYYI